MIPVSLSGVLAFNALPDNPLFQFPESSIPVPKEVLFEVTDKSAAAAIGVVDEPVGTCRVHHLGGEVLDWSAHLAGH